MGKCNQKACPYTEKEREQSFSSDPKRKGERSKAGHCPFLGQTQTIGQQAQKETVRSCTGHPNRWNRIGNFFLFPFFRFGYEMLLLIFFFSWLGRFRFDSFLFWVLGFSIKMFVDMVSIVFPNPLLSLPSVINLLPLPKLIPPLFLFSNLPNPSLYNDEENFRSCYRLFEVTALQFNIKNMFTVIGLVFLQKLCR